jgi:tRNA A37 N6-isopentenylltransferase MiaA
MLKEDIVPILVGGTHYYIQSIIWEVLIDSQTVPDIPAGTSSKTAIKTDLLKQNENSMCFYTKFEMNHGSKIIKKFSIFQILKL